MILDLMKMNGRMEWSECIIRLVVLVSPTPRHSISRKMLLILTKVTKIVISIRIV